MLWLILSTSAFAAGDFRVEPCRHVLNVDIAFSVAPSSDARRLDIRSCGAGIASDASSGRDLIRLRIRSDDGRLTHIVADDPKRNIRVEKSDIPLGVRTQFGSDAPGREWRVSVRITPDTKNDDSPKLLSVDIENQPIDAVAARLQAIGGWTLRGAELLGDRRATFRFESIPLDSMLQLIADVAGVDIQSNGVDEATFSRRASSP